ncbi:flagellar basal-body rod protein FlgF [Desulforamulus aquiferis]|uniref:Flagellar basal-body rod protein FlgF n=1 Tax=Desulforamulus aquiferis TaxID=1397668 RepID=A0AAW7ZG51_9FIRM|nr:flagellar basal-body rod protein FlgF [Desulforamulus aquiferis]MDO7788373.1 flagellar basal-body rod protein FlgF [Desulforamulus aquiferis]RYD03084.1 hypothetical protein N752_21985 [Desulforamulus aquiferis]
MLRSLYSGISGLRNHQTRMDVVGNNIANVNTTGYKSGRVNFQDSLSQYYSNNAAIGQNQVGTGMKVASINNNFIQGPLQNTGRTLDLSIQGDGFFTLQDANGNLSYTREGIFFVNASGELVNSDGYLVVDDGGSPITLTPPINQLSINELGEIFENGSTTATAQIGITTFANREGLAKAGNNRYLETMASGTPTLGAPNSDNVVISGYLEMSNVDLSQEMVDMMVTQRGFQANSRVITVSDSLLEELVNLKR